MKTFIISTEGQSEERFVKEALRPFLNRFVHVEAINLGTGRGRNGGWHSFEQLKNEINTLLYDPVYKNKNRNALITTMYDFSDIRNDFPDFLKITSNPDKYEAVALAESVLQGQFPKDRFVPYFQLHQFESLIFTNPEVLLYEYPDEQDGIVELVKQKDSYENENPELINSTNKPSYRIETAIGRPAGSFKGTTIGDLTAQIGVLALRQACRHFNDWLTKLETLA